MRVVYTIIVYIIQIEDANIVTKLLFRSNQTATE